MESLCSFRQQNHERRKFGDHKSDGHIRASHTELFSE